MLNLASVDAGSGDIVNALFASLASGAPTWSFLQIVGYEREDDVTGRGRVAVVPAPCVHTLAGQ